MYICIIIKIILTFFVRFKLFVVVVIKTRAAFMYYSSAFSAILIYQESLFFYEYMNCMFGCRGYRYVGIFFVLIRKQTKRGKIIQTFRKILTTD